MWQFVYQKCLCKVVALNEYHTVRSAVRVTGRQYTSRAKHPVCAQSYIRFFDNSETVQIEDIVRFYVSVTYMCQRCEE